MINRNKTAEEETVGLSASTIKQINTVMANYPAIEKVILYGSRAKGNFRPASDIDLAILGDRFTDEQLLNLETRLDDLLLPYSIDICRFSAIQNHDLICHINRAGKVFYQRPPEING